MCIDVGRWRSGQPASPHVIVRLNCTYHVARISLTRLFTWPLGVRPVQETCLVNTHVFGVSESGTARPLVVQSWAVYAQHRPMGRCLSGLFPHVNTAYTLFTTKLLYITRPHEIPLRSNEIVILFRSLEICISFPRNSIAFPHNKPLSRSLKISISFPRKKYFIPFKYFCVLLQ